jgi:hypothetical protein
MNCKGSPKSNISTGVSASPCQKVKFSRKFVIEMQETEENKEVNSLQQKYLRYKRRYRVKKNKVEEEAKRNKEFRQELDFENDQISQMKKELEKEFLAFEKLNNEDRGIEKGLQQMIEILNSETFNGFRKDGEDSEFPHSLTSTHLEELQEHLFISNKKASDLERIMLREQKKNESLSKELRMLKIDLSSKKSSGAN